MGQLKKVVLVAIVMLNLAFVACSKEDLAIYDEPVERLSTDDNQDADHELEPNN